MISSISLYLKTSCDLKLKREERPGLKLPRLSELNFELKSPIRPSSSVSVIADGCASSSKIHRVERKHLFSLILLWEG